MCSLSSQHLALHVRYLRENWDDLMTFADFCEGVKNEPCPTCYGIRQIQTTEWPALFDVCPDCRNGMDEGRRTQKIETTTEAL